MGDGMEGLRDRIARWGMRQKWEEKREVEERRGAEPVSTVTRKVKKTPYLSKRRGINLVPKREKKLE